MRRGYNNTQNQHRRGFSSGRYTTSPRRNGPSLNQRPVSSGDTPSLETVVARLETTCQLLHAIPLNCTRPDEICSEIKLLSDDLLRVGPALETAYPDVLDRVISSMRDASSHPSLPPALRLAIFQLVELRAAHWVMAPESHNYYKDRAQGILESESGGVGSVALSGSSSSPMIVIGNDEIPEPPVEATEPVCKAYRQEIIIKNSDSGKVMGVRGRRVHLIEALSDTIISFEKINPSAKERVLSVHGQSYQAINMARDLIQETIQRNASPELDIESMEKIHDNHQHPNQQPSGEGCSTSAALPMPSSSATTTSRNPSTSAQMQMDKEPEEIPCFSYSVHLGNDVIKISGNNLQYVQEAKLSLDEFFCGKYPQLFYLSSGEECLGTNSSSHVPNGNSNGRLQYDREMLLKLGAISYPQPQIFQNLEPSIRDSIILKK